MNTTKPLIPIPGDMPMQDTPFGLHIANNITTCRTFIDSLQSFYEVDDKNDLKGFFRDMPEQLEHHRYTHEHVWYIVHNLPKMQYEIRQEYHEARRKMYREEAQERTA